MASARPPRLLLIGTAGFVGGMERIVVVLTRELRARGWDVRTVFPAAANSDALVGWAQSQGVDVEVSDAVPELLGDHSLGKMRAFRAFVRDAKPDVVNIHYPGGHMAIKDIVAARTASRRHRLVATIHHPVYWSESGNRKKQMTRAAALLCAAVTVPAHSVKRIMQEAGVPATKVHVIPNGVAPPGVRSSRDEARARMGIATSAFMIASLCRLEEGKGVDDLISAIAAMPTGDDGPRLVVGGDGSMRERLAAFARDRLADRGSLLGRVPEGQPIADLFAAADVFALPSHRESFGLVIVEAALHGIPGVGAINGGTEDVIRDGDTGFLVHPGDIDALARALQTLRDDPVLRRRMGEAARRRAETEFTVGRMIDRYASVLHPATR